MSIWNSNVSKIKQEGVAEGLVSHALVASIQLVLNLYYFTFFSFCSFFKVALFFLLFTSNVLSS